MRLLLQRRLEGGERLLRHAVVEQHGAVELARRRQRPRRHRRLLGPVLGVGRGAHCGERVSGLALRIEEPRCRNLPFDVDLSGPVGVLGFGELVAQLAELGDVGSRFVRPGFSSHKSLVTSR